ncbi:uncharacterized protein VICG_01088 [Vittaforma corneae ATCC 50505]|uniref:Zinc/iron permease n=1 Tax=Vittaforma corneae (strain ATCC 50505) TaxID=993615 RepID=L2GMN9_VITCO|nr:uncharacterized protein VICG_01088 [Vittaforma corneae ATCC 50505]ELA41904.1 hypothetical protein VICG_01088 [Vittaforma corneae ATCC 50505]
MPEHSESTPSIFANLTVPFSILLISMVSCLLPRILSNSKIVRKYFSMVNVFNSGLQLSTIIVDLIPHMNLKKGDHHHASDLYPFVASGVCFIALVAIDSIFLHPSEEEPTKKQSENHNKEVLQHLHHHKCLHNHTSSQHEELAHQHGGDCHESLGTCNTGAISKSQTKAKAFLYLFAISVHSFFEGLGFEINLKHIPLLAGLIFHKILESFAIGASVHESIFSNSSKMFLLLIYSVLTPAAIMLRGLSIFTKHTALKQWTMGLCLGALMFVVFFEVIGHSFHGGKDNIRKVFSISFGYVLGCTAIILSHGHGHHHHH